MCMCLKLQMPYQSVGPQGKCYTQDHWMYKIVGVDEKEVARPFEGESAICTNAHHLACFTTKT